MPRFVWLCCGLLCMAGILALSYGVYDYCRLKGLAYHISTVQARVVEQRDVIAKQRGQIQSFASEINRLKGRLVTLTNFEEKLRIVANIDSASGEENLFGIGGSIPEDLDTGIDLHSSHKELIRDMHEQLGQLEYVSRRQQDSLELLLEAIKGQRDFLAATPAIRPAKGWISSSFGYRKSPFTGQREFHKGIDIANQRGTKIVASADGIVKYAGRKGLLGKVLVIDHGHGMLTRYGHLDKALKKSGQKVERGDVIAEMGNSGKSTGPHLHYEVHLNGVPVNPRKYILN